MAAETKQRGCDGVVCGHIHKAEIREIGDVIYANDGDWVESMTALVEEMDGTLRVLDWFEIQNAHRNNQSGDHKVLGEGLEVIEMEEDLVN